MPLTWQSRINTRACSLHQRATAGQYRLVVQVPIGFHPLAARGHDRMRKEIDHALQQGNRLLGVGLAPRGVTGRHLFIARQRPAPILDLQRRVLAVEVVGGLRAVEDPQVGLITIQPFDAGGEELRVVRRPPFLRQAVDAHVRLDPSRQFLLGPGRAVGRDIVGPAEVQQLGRRRGRRLGVSRMGTASLAESSTLRRTRQR